MNTNDKIIEILKQHPEGGETFFNALDLMLRSDFDILAELKELIGKNITNLKMLILFFPDILVQLLLIMIIFGYPSLRISI